MYNKSKLLAFLLLAFFSYSVLSVPRIKSDELIQGSNEENESISLREGQRRSQFKIGIKNSKEQLEFIHKLDSFYNGLQKRGWSGAVLIAYKGIPLYNRYMGFSNYASQTPNNASTTFQLASTSKPFTAIAILQLQERGKLNIHDNVQKYIPEFPYNNISIKNLLTHTSGLQDYINFANACWNTKNSGYLSNEGLITMIADKKPNLIFVPGTKFKYTNTNYALLASIVERVSDKPFKQYMSDNIFRPLKMENTYVLDPRDDYPTNASKCYKGGWNEYVYNYQDGVFGDKGVYSNVRDMLKFDRALYSNRLLSSQSINAAMSPQNMFMPSPRNYGLGWRMFNYPSGEKIVYHNGLWHGNNSVFYRFIQDDMTIIVQCNKFTNTTYDQPSQICGLLAQVEGVKTTTNFDSED